MGLYTENADGEMPPLQQLAEKILGSPLQAPVTVERFCDDCEGEVYRYHVYRLSADGCRYILKRTEGEECFVHERLLAGKKFPVQTYYGSAQQEHEKWILLDYIEGTDLRRFSEKSAYEAAKSVAQMMNAYWQRSEKELKGDRGESRFDQYWARINRRAQCLKEEPILMDAYQLFLERQLTCPKTLCNGDLLPFNCICGKDGRVWIIDWAFGGILPYSLDAARLIAHGNEEWDGTTPFYMTQSHKDIFLQTLYTDLDQKPTWECYRRDIRLSLLNEYIEMIEEPLKTNSADKAGFYYNKALQLAKQLLED